jgi:hypothetical protein
MEENPRPSMWERTITRRFLRWLFSARTLRRGSIALAWIVSLIALYYGIVDWRGRHAWNEYRQNYEAHVAPLEFQAYTPKPIPDSENFAATPFVQSWFKQDTIFLFDHDAWYQSDKMIGDPPKRPARRKYEKHFENLVAWQEAFAAVRSHAAKPKNGFWSDKLDLASRAQAAPTVLDGLKDDEAVLEELRQASARPDARYPVVYDMENPCATLLPYLPVIKKTCLRLELRACTELAAGQNENALDDVRLMLYLADTAKTEPCLISYLVRIACVHVAIQPIWEGLAEHRWTDAQLQQLQARLEPYNFLADLQRSLHGERAQGVLTMDLLRKKGLGLLADNSSPYSSEQVLNLLGRIVPSGWFDQEKLHYCLLFDDEFRGTVDETSRRVFPHQVATNASESGTLAEGKWQAIIHHQFIAKMMLSDLAKIPIPAAMAQVASDQAAIACALERYRLANGQFPENLQALVPRFITHLPNDVITGESFKYRRTDDGRFVLYSVGWNEKDDGGIPGKTMFDETEGDWVWEYPVGK